MATEGNTSSKQNQYFLPKIQSNFHKNFQEKVNLKQSSTYTNTNNSNTKATSQIKNKRVIRSNSTSHKIICKSKRKENNNITISNTLEFLFEVYILI